jgi:hypothetical protein
MLQQARNGGSAQALLSGYTITVLWGDGTSNTIVTATSRGASPIPTGMKQLDRKGPLAGRVSKVARPGAVSVPRLGAGTARCVLRADTYSLFMYTRMLRALCNLRGGRRRCSCSTGGASERRRA